MYLNVISVILASAFSLVAMASPAALTYQGRIVKYDGTPLEYSSVSFIFQLTDPTGQCILYQEQVDGIDMTHSSGIFDVPIGKGAVTFPTSGSFTVLDAFNNSANFSCKGGAGYTAISGDQRKLRVQFHDGIGWRQINEDTTIRSVPYAGYALSAEKLGNNPVGSFVLKTGIPICSAGTALSWDGASFSCVTASGGGGGSGLTSLSSANSYITVTNGTSTAQVALNVGASANTVAAGDDPRLVNALQISSTTAATCSASQSLYWNSVAGAFQCQAINVGLAGDVTGSIGAAKVVALQNRPVATTAPASNQVLQWNGSQWSPATLASTDLPASGVAAGTYKSVNVDIYGRVTAGTNPTTVAGFGITDAVENDGGTPAIQSGLDASKPAASLAGKVYIATDTKKIYRDTGSAWDLIGTGTGGTVTNVATGTGLSGGPITSTGTISLANTAVTPASYGSATSVPTFTVDAQGRLTAASNVTITGTTPGGTAGGDLGGTYPNPTLAKISGTTLTIASLASGQYLKYNGTNWANSAIAISDVTNLTTQLSNKIDAANMPASCAANQTLTFSSPTGTWACSAIAITGSAFGSQAAATVLAAPTGAAGTPTFRALASTDLPTSGVGAGTYKSVTVDIFGRVTAGTSPTTLAGYGITDSVKNDGSTPSIQSGLDASKPAVGTTGKVYIATDTKKIYRDTGAAWDMIGSASGGTVTSVATGTGLSGGPITATGTISLANTAVTPASYGSATSVPTFTVDAQGRLTAAANVTITGTTPGGTAGGDLGGTYPNPTLAKISGTTLTIASLASGQYLKYNGTNWANSAIAIADVTSLSTQLGNKIDASQMPTSCAANQTLTFSSPTGSWLCSSIAITGSAFGSQAAATVLAAPTGAAGTPTFRALASTDLPTSGVTAGTYKSVTVDSYGRVTSASNPTTIGGYGITDAFVNGGNSFGGTAVLGTNDTNNLAIETAGATRMTILSAGNVGVGTTNPQAALDVGGQYVLVGPTAAGTLSGMQVRDNNGVANFGMSWTSSSSFNINLASPSAMTFGTGNTERMRILSGGNVGIGTTGPTAPLDVAGTAAYTVNVRSSSVDATGIGFFNSSSNRTWGIGVGGSGPSTVGAVGGKFSIWDVNAGAARMVIDTNGYVGVNNNNPSYRMDIVGTARISGGSNYTLGLATSHDLALETTTTNRKFLFGGTGGGYAMQSTEYSTGNPLTLALNPTAGDVGVNTQPGTVMDGVMQIEGGALSTGKFSLTIRDNEQYASLASVAPLTTSFSISANSGGGHREVDFYNRDATSAGSPNRGFRFHQQNGTGSFATIFQVTGAGAAWANSWNSWSDARLKENVTEIESPLEKVLHLRGVEFDWIKNKTPWAIDKAHDMGVIAQEVEKVFPEAVTENSGYKSVAYSKLVAPLIGATKELYGMCKGNSEALIDQSRKIASLEEENRKMKSENAVLKAAVDEHERKMKLLEIRMQALEKGLQR